MIPYSVPVETLLKHAWEIGTWRNRPTCFFISSPPRAGSTWVLEAIERHVYARRHYEPVRGLLTDPPRRVEACRAF